MSDRIEKLEQRVAVLEDAIAKLDNRTFPMQIFGPESREEPTTNKRLEDALKEISDEDLRLIRDKIDELQGHPQ